MTREEVIKAIENYKSLRGADLRGVDISGASLRGADLRGAQLPFFMDGNTKIGEKQ